ncbi:MAG: hypothetical protein ACREFZ_02655 [Acetobacteraceae bacterium]
MTKMAVYGALALAAACVPWVSGATAEAATSNQSSTVYVAQLEPMNTNVTTSKAMGDARFTVSGDTLTITISMEGVAPNIVHWQHFHGFKDNKNATCPTEAADANHDGIIDLIETEPTSGTTMVPFDSDPAAMDIAHGTYPKASADGTYQYHATVSLPALKAAFAKAFGDPNLDLAKRVVFIHGVPASTKLPSSVASLGPIPAQVTIPIACGKIEPAK